ncbi:MAG: protein kinase [Vicinamibacterales bacterium]
MTTDLDPPPEDDAAPTGGGEDALDAGLLSAAEALADGHWSTGAADPPLLSELNIIAAVQRLHREAARAEQDEAGLAVESSASLGEVLSRALPSTTRPDLSGARRWGPLFVLERVGSGSFGQVYRAWDPALDREVALKLLPFAHAEREARAVVREGQLLASVRHPNIISVYGAAAIDGEVGIWMEFVRGRTLDQIVRDDGPMSAQEALVVADSLCGALAAVHQAGLVHRDVKGANVMRASGGRIVLLDFGTGIEERHDRADPHRLAGTPLYLAPELFEGAAPSARTDVYSLGVLLFFLVTGTYPVYGKSLRDVRAAHASRRALRLSEVRADLPLTFVRAVDRALSTDPRRRIPSAPMLLDALQSSETVSAPSGGPRATWVVRVIGATVAAVVTVGALGFISSVTYRMGLGEDLATERPVEWVVWGVRSLVAPLVFAAVVMMAAILLRVLLGGALALAGRLVAGPTRGPGLAGTEARLLARLESDTGVQWLLVLQVATLAVLLVTFGSLLSAVFSFVLPSETSNLFPLRPGNNAEHMRYRQALALHALVFGVAWARAAFIGHLPRRAERRAVIAAGTAAFVLTLGVLSLPFRILYHSSGERVWYRGEACYLVHAAEGRGRLICPLARVIRRTVTLGEPGLDRTGEFESIFTPLDRVARPAGGRALLDGGSPP